MRASGRDWPGHVTSPQMAQRPLSASDPPIVEEWISYTVFVSWLAAAFGHGTAVAETRVAGRPARQRSQTQVRSPTTSTLSAFCENFTRPETELPFVATRCATAEGPT